MNIGETSRLTGLSARTIRHYEAVGIIAPAVRDGSGYRRYGPEDIRTLNFVRNARKLRFDLREIRLLVRHWREGPATGEQIARLLSGRVSKLLAQESELRASRTTLEGIQRDSEGGCNPGCRIVALLAEG